MEDTREDDLSVDQSDGMSPCFDAELRAHIAEANDELPMPNDNNSEDSSSSHEEDD